jgi:hypothetical protein
MLSLKLAALACALLFAALPSFGVCFQPDPTVACEFSNSDAVFVGAVVSAQEVPALGKWFDDGWVYDLTVQEAFRGPRRKTIEAFTEKNSGGLYLDIGKEYLLFATEFHGRLTIYNCGNSSLLPDAQKALRELRGLEIPKDAVIEGRISFSGIPDSGTHIPGIRIIIRGGGRTFKATSDGDGWFHLHIPPGKYSAEIRQIPHWNIAPYDLSYDDPDHFDARKGHCSGLQFIANPK